MRVGVNYYPEHWERKLWVEDADRMKEIGVEVVRLAELACSKM